MIFVLILLNLAISTFNAWACGRAWPESKHQGGMAHFMNWMGAIMAACGFTWCIVVVLAMGLSSFSYHPDDANPQLAVPLITPEMARAIIELGLVAIIVPILGSGLAITIDTWARFYRDRTFGNGALAVYNTSAQMYNMYEAATVLPSVLGDLKGFFGGGSSSSSSSSSSDSSTKGIIIVVLIVLCSLVGGILITRAIIMATARSAARERLEGMRMASAR